jgi:hypothetical protein
MKYSLSFLFLLLAPFAAHATLLEDLIGFNAALYGTHILIKDSRTVYVWRARTGELAECVILRAPQTLSALNQLAYEPSQFSGTQTLGTYGEAECYKQKLP